MNDKQIPTDEMSRWKKFSIIMVLSLALAIIILDGTILNVSFGYIIRDLNTSIESLQWVITAYALTIAALTVTGGRMGDLFGRKKMFRLGAILFAIGSLICSISKSVGVMITGESIIEGIGAALMMPATISLLASTFRGPSRAMAMGVWGATAGASSALGPVIGGYLTTNYSWRWAFRINIFVVGILLLGSFLLKEYKEIEEKSKLDITGVVLSSLGLLTLVFGIIKSSTYGWLKAKEIFVFSGHSFDLGNVSIVVPFLILSIIFLTVFVLWENKIEREGSTPIVSMNIFKNRQFTFGTLVVAVMALGQAGLIFSIPIYFQSVRGFDAYHTGLVIMPASLVAFVLAPTAAFLSRKITPKLLIQAGILLIAIAMYMFYEKLGLTTSSRDMLPAMIVYGAGIGLMMAQATNMVMSSVSPEQAGEVAGVNNTMRQIGMTLGTAIVGAVLLATLTTKLTGGIAESKVIPEASKSKITEVVTAEASNIEFSNTAGKENTIPPSLKDEIIRISHQAATDSARHSLLYVEPFILLGFVISFFLPNRKNLEQNVSLASKKS